MRFLAPLLFALLFVSCQAPAPRQVSCKPPLPVLRHEVEPPPMALRKVTLVTLPSGEQVEEVRR